MLDHTNSSILYVSQSDGDDNNSGFERTSDVYGRGPLKSIEAAVLILRQMRASGCLQPMTVKFIGDYYLSEPISPGFENNTKYFAKNFKMENVTFESADEKRSRIIGGKKLTGFKKDVFNGVDCVSLHIPEVENGEWLFSDLYAEGKRASLTRFPKDSTLRAVTTEVPNPPVFSHGSKWFIAHKEDLEGIDVENTIVSYFHYWIDEHSPVESYDPETGKLTMKLRSRFKITTNYEADDSSLLYYYLENVPTTFSTPGEWFLEVKTGMLYYIPLSPDTAPDELEVFAPALDQLVLIKGTAENHVFGIRFNNLDFLCTKGDYVSKYRSEVTNDILDEDVGFASDAQSVFGAYGAISFEYADNCEVRNCGVYCTGIHAIEISKGCKAIRVEGCNLSELGGGGVKILGASANEDKCDETAYCTVRNNVISHLGIRFAAACGVLICHSPYNEISYNDIGYTDYTGISVGWEWGYKESTTMGNTIRGNHIHHIGAGRLSDMGGVYLLGPQSGTVVEDNIIHDVTSAHYGGWGIYTDEGSSYISIRGNTVYNCKCQCLHQHYGSYNTVTDNIFVGGGDTLVWPSRTEAHIGLVCQNNTFITNGKPVYPGKGGDEKKIMLSLKSSKNKIWDMSGKEPVMAIIQSEGKTVELSLKDWQKLIGKDEGSKIEKPDLSSEKFKFLSEVKDYQDLNNNKGQVLH